MKVLIVKTSSMGDILHTLPAVTDAMHAIANISFDWVVEENFAEIPTWHPAVNQVIPVALRRWRKNWFNPQIRQQRHHFIEQLQQQHYDAIIDAQGLIKSAFFVTRKASGVKHGLDWHSAREPIASLFYDKKYAIAKNQHAVERIRQLFAKSLDYSLPSTQGDYAIADYFVNQISPITEEPYLVFLHATTRENKHWPEQRWIELIELLQPRGIKIKLPWGAPHEWERAERLAKNHLNVEVLPKLTLAEVANQLAHAKAVVSVDTGLSHLAAALDKPNITLYGPTDPGLIGGYGRNQTRLQSKTGCLNATDAVSVQTLLNTFI